VKTVACAAPYGQGGLGKHFAQLVENVRAEGLLAAYYSTAIREGDELIASAIHSHLATAIAQVPPIRFDPGQRLFVNWDRFDRAVARRLVEAEVHTGFSGQSLRTFARARKRSAVHLTLVSPTAHVDHVARQHALARRSFPIESDWLSNLLRLKCLREYALADTILVSSAYAYDSFVAEGIPHNRLRRFDLRPDSYFSPPRATSGRDGIFRIAYVGSLSVTKGVPVLLQAFSGITDPKAELTLIGGYGTRPMRRYLERACRRDARIHITQGDPLPHLRQTDVYVHPSYHDGLGLAALEALACGVRVIATEDTGMKEYLEEGVNGFIIPTGDADKLRERLEQLVAEASVK
jgi:glycosyltransferase involved in cell wall biosynthesis